MLGSFWDHFGIILEPFWDDFGIILGSFWHRKDLRKNEGLGSRRFHIFLHPRAIQIRNDFLVSGNSLFSSPMGGGVYFGILLHCCDIVFLIL